MYLLKNAALAILAFFLFSTPAMASLVILDPVEETVPLAGTVMLGRMQAGESASVTIDRRAPGVFWEALAVDMALRPAGWRSEVRTADQSFFMTLSPPLNAEPGAYRIRVIATSGGLEEFFDLDVVIEEGLLLASLVEHEEQVAAGAKTSFLLRLSNQSIAAHSVTVTSSLPQNWFSGVGVDVAPGTTEEVSLKVTGASVGVRQFAFSVSSELDRDVSFRLPAILRVSPTLTGGYLAIANGFPFFTPSLYPMYLLDGFLVALGNLLAAG